MSSGSGVPTSMSAEEIAEQRRMLDHFERMNLDRDAKSQAGGVESSREQYAPPPGPPPAYQPPAGPPPSQDAAYQKVPSPSPPKDAYHPPPGPPPSHSTAYQPATSTNQSEDAAGSRNGADAEEAQILNTALDFAHQRPPPPAGSMPNLPLPVAVPQLTGGFGDPFARAYAPALAAHGISAQEFVAFIDGFNIVTTNSPPLQVLDLAGGAVGFVPWHWAQLVSTAISATAKIGARVLSKTMGDRFLKRANDEFFHPRQLHVVIARTEALRSMARIPPDAPLAAPLTASTMDMSIAERRMSALQPWLSPLTMDVPPPTPQTNVLKRLCEKQAERQATKSETKMKKERLKALEKGEMLPPEEEQRLMQSLTQSSDPKLADEARKVAEKRQDEHEKQSKEVRKMEREREKIEREAEKDIAKARRKGEPKKEREALEKREEELAKLDKDIHKDTIKRRKSFEKDDKEKKQAAKGKWMVVHAWDGQQQA